MKFLKKLDKGVDTGIKYFTAVLMIILTIIVNAMVFSRYLFRVNLGGMEELPVYLMCICIWMGAVRVARDDKFVKIEIIFSLVKNEKAQTVIKMLASLAGGVVLAYFCKCAYQLVYRSIESETISPAMGFPMWMAYIFCLIGSVGMTIYFFVNTIKYLRRLKEL